MYPDNLFGKRMYLVPDITKLLTYEERREEFNKMIFACKFLCADIGHSDMLILFDDERKCEEAKKIMNERDILFTERNLI